MDRRRLVRFWFRLSASARVFTARPVAQRITAANGLRDTSSCSITGRTLTQIYEADEVAYFAVDDIPSNTLPEQVERIHDALTPNAEVLSKLSSAPRQQHSSDNGRRSSLSSRTERVTQSPAPR